MKFVKRESADQFIAFVFIFTQILELSFAKEEKGTKECQELKISFCSDFDVYMTHGVGFPNIEKQKSQMAALISIRKFYKLLEVAECRRPLKELLCTSYLPICGPSNGKPLYPCKHMCMSTLQSCKAALKSTGFKWPPELNCEKLSNQSCYEPGIKLPRPADSDKKKQVTRKTAGHRHKTVSSGGEGKIHPRRYDIEEKGNPFYFQGWADVQGQGAPNDYCRVIGNNPKHWFLSCSLAGTKGPNHTYVSRRGISLGHPDSWFMKDMDGDGRDDYCRCMYYGKGSKIKCTKAGPMGFFGGPLQPGKELTFEVRMHGPCQGQTFNPFLGL